MTRTTFQELVENRCDFMGDERMTRNEAAERLRTVKYTCTALCDTDKRAIDVALEALQPTVKPTLEGIINAVCDTTGVTHEELVMRCRCQEYVDARYMVVWLVRRHTNFTLTTIARRLGYKGHVACVHALELGEYWYQHPEINPKWVSMAESIIKKIKT